MSNFKNFKASGNGFSANIDLGRFNTQHGNAQAWLDNQVIVDSTPFVPMNTGALYRSAISGTTLGSGLVVWDCQYARNCYYGTEMNFRTDKHPQAQAGWFEAAKAVHKNDWLKTARALGGGG